MKAPVRVAVTGAAGQIGYALLFRIASGEMLGKDQPVILQLLELSNEKAQAALKGVMMELEDCAFPLLAGMVGTDDAEVAFKDIDVALLVGARPRGPGMERKDLLLENAKIFTAQGAALNKVAKRDVKVLVVGNPANTNAYIAMKSAPDLNPNNFTAMLRLDHNRALSQLALKLGKPVGGIEKLVVWGNHSPTMYRTIVSPPPMVRPSAMRSTTRNGMHPPSFRPWASAAQRSSKRVACRPQRRLPMPPSITCVTGCWAATASGSPWACRRTAPMAFRKA